ncbi:MAG: hypothetical protein HY912_23265 [Desulfomonile tiedjei]|uniref:Uncharacterized protein n=1 Tax=Desulfomonile tiedjei TaxID=2358 RepID=A0A9D6V5E1_9BACT|nr:hypothetical protein [Desulfomonile tiedjei]
MTTIFAEILKALLFKGEPDRDLVVLSDPTNNDRDRKVTGAYGFPEGVFPDFCAIRKLAGGEGFISAMKDMLVLEKPTRLFIVPPFQSYKDLPNQLSTEFHSMNLEEIVIQVAMQNLNPGTIVGVLLPLGTLVDEHSRGFRERLSDSGTIMYVIELSNRQQLLPDVHSAFRMVIVIMIAGKADSELLRFWKMPDTVEEEQDEPIVSDLLRLSKQQGGQTNFGYVLRQRLPQGSPLSFDMYHPSVGKTIRDISILGAVRPLGELAEVFFGHLNLRRDAAMLTDSDSDRGIPVIEGRDILSDGTIVVENTRYTSKHVPPEKCLKPGDICTRRLVGPKPFRFYVTQIQESNLVSASDSVIIIRRRSSTGDEDWLILKLFLRSPKFLELLASQTTSQSIRIGDFRNIPVPISDPTLKLALTELLQASEIFSVWKTETEKAIGSLFDFESVKDSRMYLLSQGRRLRQRVHAARQMDEFSYRVRTQFPHPIAFRWRTVESCKPDLEGYLYVLECAEITLCYLASMAIVLAYRVMNDEIKRLSEIAKRLADRASGTSMGDWVAILIDARKFRRLSSTRESIPFYEVLLCLDDNRIKQALDNLKRRRNDQAHGRGPKGSDIPKAFKEARSDLEQLLEGIEFVSEYPLIYVEVTERDSLQRTTEYQYRTLMGDHPLVPLQRNTTQMAEVEAHSLYLLDRNDHLYLLRPLMTRRECPHCGNWATFYLDSYNKHDDKCILKSMEHSHTVEDTNIPGAFRLLGMLPSMARRTD